MKYFFHSGISSSYGERVSSVTIKNRIKKIIEGEDPKKPLSDSKIVNILQREGPDAGAAHDCEVPRRAEDSDLEPAKSFVLARARRPCPPPPVVTVGLLDARRRIGGLSIELLAGAARPRPPDHQPLHPEDRPRARRLPRIPAGRPHPAVRRERSALPREPRRRTARRRRSRKSLQRRHCRACSSPAALPLPPEVAAEGERAGVPILRTPVPTPLAIGKLTAVLEDRLAQREIIHGVLIDILGLGVLIVGESGIGKSECALDLVVRGHRLVADDTVEVRRRAEIDRHRRLPGADAPSHGSARPRPDQHPRPVRRRRRRAPRSASSWSCSSIAGITAASTIASASTTLHHDLLGLKVPLIRCRSRRAATWRSSSKSRRAISCCARAASTPRASWSARLDAAARNAPAPARRRRRRRRPRRRRRSVRRGASRSCERGRRAPLHRPHRAVGLGQVAGDSRARGPRLLLRRQPAGVAAAGAGASWAERQTEALIASRS